MESENFSKVQMYVQQSIIDKKDEIIRQQQAEIERLRADMQEIIDLSYTAFPVANMRYVAEHALGQHKPPQESLTPAELGELAGKAEAVQGALTNQVLKYLASVDEPKTNFEIEDELGSFVSFTLLGSCKDGLIERQERGYYTITKAGRDYLASLETPKAE